MIHFKDHLVTELAGFLRKKCLCPRMREELSDILDIMRSIKLVNLKEHFFFNKSCCECYCLKIL